MDIITSSFFLLYSNSAFSCMHVLDRFYAEQTKTGYIPPVLSKKTGKSPIQSEDTKQIVSPILLWAEYNYYNRIDNKKRLKEILPKLDAYLHWLEDNFRDEKTGLFITPQSASISYNIPRDNAVYLLDFNAHMAIAYHFMIKLSSATNLRNFVFKYTKYFYSLKALINDNFWDNVEGFYFDLDKDMNFTGEKTLNAFWLLLPQIPNNSQSTMLRKHLEDPAHFSSENPFPFLSQDSKYFSEQGNGFLGSVFPFHIYMVIKGLSAYGFHEFARESAMRHLSAILANFYSPKNTDGDFWEAYQPNKFLPAKSTSKNHPIRKNFFSSVGLSTISLIIENIIGFDICLPKKMVYWTLPHLEYMGIESLQLKRNMISTILQHKSRGWEIRHGSEKLYYFSVDILEKKKQKTLPIPSGKCSLLVDKL